MKKVPIFKKTPKGNITGFNLNPDLANDNWLKAARLKKKANEGDAEAEAELEKMENTPMYEEE